MWISINFNNLHKKKPIILSLNKIFRNFTFGTNTKHTVAVVQITIKKELRKYES